MIGSARSGVNQTTSDTRHQQVVINDQFNSRVQRLLALFQHIIQLFSLSDSTRETIQNETIEWILAFRSLSCATLPLAVNSTTLTYAHTCSTYPFLHSALLSRFSSIIPTTISSETRPPASMTFLASKPRGVLAATAARSISPVAK